MNTALVLLEKAKALLKYCNSDCFDQKTFAINSKNFYDLYKRCDVGTQGLYHQLWHNHLKD